MNEIKNNMMVSYCKSCGAPMTSDICPYCGTSMLIQKEFEKKEEINDSFEYPAIICDEVTNRLYDWGMMVLYAVFGLTFGIIGFGNFFSNMQNHHLMESDVVTFIMFSPFMAVSAGMFIAVFKYIYRFVKIRSKGQRIVATVLGYKTEYLNKKHSRYFIELDAEMPQGKRRLKYDMHTSDQPYQIGAQVELLYIGRLYYLKGFLT